MSYKSERLSKNGDSGGEEKVPLVQPGRRADCAKCFLDGWVCFDLANGRVAVRTQTGAETVRPENTSGCPIVTAEAMINETRAAIGSALAAEVRQ